MCTERTLRHVSAPQWGICAVCIHLSSALVHDEQTTVTRETFLLLLGIPTVVVKGKCC